jgi:hypothetical protein
VTFVTIPLKFIEEVITESELVEVAQIWFEKLTVPTVTRHVNNRMQNKKLINTECYYDLYINIKKWETGSKFYLC